MEPIWIRWQEGFTMASCTCFPTGGRIAATFFPWEITGVIYQMLVSANEKT